ncbi:MAG: bifunctional 2-polyprenyl-6-hydroxyphenol methylase/3-demethylubiquinol 3-O-methyltransferase UbiG [Candidatus Endonucleobacter sp. (ex Gigantidas childressi)]|nr:bifunctional 2-polyprenyl-6-hydroxyphenol methylase/3-demethylubiquinol 3-O-methyltransferase UbiG [Candidatus Endonucleobacter sp. (ex Gigantidas childressi)]
MDHCYHPNELSIMQSTQNVDSEEIAKFEQLSSRWWDPESEFKPLHAINPLRLNFIDQRIGLAKKKILDVGCGGGILSESMALRGGIITGIDMGDAPLTVARLHSIESNVEVSYRKITVEELAEEMPCEFDAITCLEMLEHVPNPASVVQACRKLLKPNGDVFFATLNRTTKSWLFAIMAAEYILKLLPKGTHKHSKFIKPHELSQWMRQNNIKLMEISGMTYNPLTKVYRLNKTDTDVNYILHGKLQT